MKEFIISEAQTEKAVLVGLVTPEQNEQKVKEYLDELAFLADTAGVDAVKRFTQKMDYPNSVTFVGTGKLQEIKEYVVENEIGLVIFDDELSPKQLRNIEKELQVKILDRTSLILDIFASRAQTAHAKTQVELAQYKYMLPRLTRLWTHLERQRGGVGMRGPGETQLETDKRIILDKIARLKKELVDIDKQKSVQRKNRGKMVRVALVGYTNVGKSTLMNLLSKSEVFAENKLFATLDTTVRKVIIENLPFLLSDTVGFIRKLPTELVESFKSTLDEVREADLLVHIVDISHPTFEEQIEVVNRTLAEIDKTEKPMIMVFNNVDAFTFVPKEEDDLTPRGRENIDLDEQKRTWMGKLQDNCIFISAKERTNIEELKEMLYERVKQVDLGYSTAHQTDLSVLNPEMANHPNIEGVTYTCGNAPVFTEQGDWYGSFYSHFCFDPNESEPNSYNPVVVADKDFFSFFKLQPISGNWPTAANPYSYIVNETCLQTLGYTNLLERPIYIKGQASQAKVCCVIKDYFYAPMQYPILPLFFTTYDNPTVKDVERPYLIYVRYAKGHKKEVLEHLREITSHIQNDNVNRNKMFTELSDLVDLFNRPEKVIFTIFSILSLVCILISTFGIYSLVSLATEQRRKEIAIRKVNGATFYHILQLFFRE